MLLQSLYFSRFLPNRPRPLSSFDTHTRWQPITQSARSRWSYGKIEDCEQSTCCWNCINLTTARPLHFSERGLPYVCVCVFPANRQVLPYSSQSKAAFWPLNKGHDPLLYPAFPLKFFQVASLPSKANGTRSPWNRVWPSQTLCPL